MVDMTLLADGAASTEAQLEPAAAVSRPPLARRMAARFWPLPAAGLAGLLLYVAFPPMGLWWLAPFGVAVFALATYRRGFWVGAGLGFVMGLSLMIPLLSWAGGYVGAVA